MGGMGGMGGGFRGAPQPGGGPGRRRSPSSRGCCGHGAKQEMLGDRAGGRRSS